MAMSSLLAYFFTIWTLVLINLDQVLSSFLPLPRIQSPEKQERTEKSEGTGVVMANKDVLTPKLENLIIKI